MEKMENVVIFQHIEINCTAMLFFFFKKNSYWKVRCGAGGEGEIPPQTWERRHWAVLWWHHAAEEGKSGGASSWADGGLLDGGTCVEVRL